MKNYFLLFLSFLALNISAQSENNSYTTEKGDIHLLGQIKRQALQKEPYKEWFDLYYDKYEPKPETVEKIDENFSSGMKIKIYLGTWCGDSKREVARFFKIVDQSKIDLSNVEMIGLDGRAEARKQGPAGEEKGLNIHRVPTFIFYKDNNEIARIVESPVNSLETDIAQIYAGLPSKPNYRVANYIGEILAGKPLVEVDTIINKSVRHFKRIIKNEGELNTMGYVLMSAKELEKAIVVFKLNTLLFPASGNVFDSLGEAYMKDGNVKLAIENYMKSLQLDTKNENAIKMVQELVFENTMDRP